MSKEELIKLLSELKKSSFNDNNALAQISEIEKIIELKNAKEQEMLKFKDELEKVEYVDDRLVNLRQIYSNSDVALKENLETINRNTMIVKYINADINQLKKEIEMLNLENEEIKLNMNEIDDENYQSKFNEQLNNNLTKISNCNEKINEYNNLINRYNQFIEVTKEQTSFLEEQVNLHKKNLEEYENNIKLKENKKDNHLEQSTQALSLMQTNFLYRDEINRMSAAVNNNMIQEDMFKKIEEYKESVSEPLLLNNLDNRNEEIIKNTMAKNYFLNKTNYVDNINNEIQKDKKDIEVAKLELKENETKYALSLLENKIVTCELDNYELENKINGLEKENKILKKQRKTALPEAKENLLVTINNNQSEINKCKQLMITNYNNISKSKKDAENVKNDLMVIGQQKESQINNNIPVLLNNEKEENKMIVSALNARNNVLKSDIPLLLGKNNQNNLDKSNAIDVEYRVLEEKEPEFDIQQTKGVKKPVQLEIKSVKRPNREKMIAKIKKVSAAILASMMLVVSVAPAVNNSNNLDNQEIKTKIVENIEDDKLMGNEDDFYDEINEEINSQIRMNDSITIVNDGNIYYTQYDATAKSNPRTPLHDRNMERSVIGVTVKMPDGSLQFAQSDEKIEAFLAQGGEITSYLTGNELEAEGFWNANDVAKVEKLNNELGGMSR